MEINGFIKLRLKLTFKMNLRVRFATKRAVVKFFKL